MKRLLRWAALAVMAVFATNCATSSHTAADATRDRAITVTRAEPGTGFEPGWTLRPISDQP